MITRPIFISTGDLDNPYIEKEISFNGTQQRDYRSKIKNLKLLKEEINKQYDIDKWLEVSTKSDKDIGIRLSALNLKILTNLRCISVENIYQSSKIFEKGKIIGFQFGNTYFENEPYGMYYDYIYMLGLHQNQCYHEEINPFRIFTDIEFNPNKSINTQARAIAIYKTLYKNNCTDIIESNEEFKRYYKENVKLKEKSL